MMKSFSADFFFFSIFDFMLLKEKNDITTLILRQSEFCKR
jgi:hypothetical protein